MSPYRSTTLGTRRLRVQGFDLAMRVQGRGAPVLLVNGMTRPLGSWDPFTQGMPDRTVVTFDAPGVGDSSPLRMPLPMQQLATMAAAVLDAAGVERADVVGFSHGGAVAQQLAGDLPERVRRLVLVATSCGVGAVPGRGGALLRSLVSSGRPWSAADACGLFWHSVAFSCWSSIPLLGGIRSPTLVVTGTHDRVVPAVNSRILAGRIPGSRLLMLPGGHDWQRPQPARRLARVVGDFLPSPVP
jgi:pimeloyl-ACP methyl ester carboxylesterase